MLKKLSLIIPLLALIALLVWWFTPHYTEEDEAYYRAVFCIIDHDDSRQFLGNDSNLLIVFYVQIVPDDFVMQLHRF